MSVLGRSRMVIWGLGVASVASLILAINVKPFVGAEPRIRASDLNFLPSPELSVALAFGHRNSVARLRWIDSLAYMQLQFDRKDDRLADGSSGFTRLYEGLLALDERFLPVYYQASLSVGNMVGRPHEALGYLMRGLLVAPKSFSLWQQSAAMLATDFDIETHQPEMFNQFLASWSAAMEDESQRNGVWQWQAALARRRFSGLEQVGYWQERLATTAANSPMAEFVEGILREQIARYGCAVLQQVADTRLADGQAVTSIEDLLDPQRLNAVGSDAHWGPVAIGAQGQPVFRPDPWGWNWVWQDGKAYSQGMRLHRYRGQIEYSNGMIALEAAQRGRWPRDLAEAQSWIIDVPHPVAGVTLIWRDQRIQVTTVAPDGEPWSLR